MRRGEGYLTVYLTLCLTIILSLYLVLIDGARRNGAGMEAICATEAGLQSIMAEYHRELLEQYNLFAIDSSYGSAVCGKKNTEAHLMEYIKKNLDVGDVLLGGYLYRDFFGLRVDDAKLTGVSLLTDGAGSVFRQRAVEAVKDDVGMNLLGSLQEWMNVIEVNGLDKSTPQEDKEKIDKEIQSYNGKEVQISEEETVVVEIQNPTGQLEVERKKGILSLVTEGELSENAIVSTGLIQSRMEQGNINLGNMEIVQSEDLVSRFLFQEYLLRYMGHFGKESDKDVLRYQLEYLIAGKDSDVENLRSVANRISVMREAANAAYLFTDKQKWLEIQGAAALVCGAFALPALIPLVQTAILLGWAYAESVYDVKTLLAGGKIPLMKNKSTWHYGLKTALAGQLVESETQGSGLAYEDYLRILMMLTDLDVLTARAMNMVEADIRGTPGNSKFRLDVCMDKLEVSVDISSSHGYKFRIDRERAY